MMSVFENNYAERTQANNELNVEIKRIINNEIGKYILKMGKKPTLLDLGSAGLYLYDAENIQQITMLDIFPKPETVKLNDITEWIVGDILADDIKTMLPEKNYDFIIMSSLLHHLCDANNKSTENLRIAFSNCRPLLKKDGEVLIFESTCPLIFGKMQDILYPLYSKILVKFLRFTYVRMTCIQEILISLRGSGFSGNLIQFKQPKYIAMLFVKIPLRFTPMKIHAIIGEAI
jgi:SAM-dependent methyltransferase